MHSLLFYFEATKSSELIQYLFVFTFGFDDDNSSWVVNDGRKLNKCPEIESSGKRYGVGDIRRTENISRKHYVLMFGGVNMSSATSQKLFDWTKLGYLVILIFCLLVSIYVLNFPNLSLIGIRMKIENHYFYLVLGVAINRTYHLSQLLLTRDYT